MQKRNKNYLETNENEDIQYQNLQDAAKVILGRKFIVVKANSEIKKYPKLPNFKLQGTRGKKNKLSSESVDGSKYQRLEQ